MKRKALGTAVVLAALAVLINVFALKTATVDNDFKMTIADTSSAMIAIIDPGVGTRDGDVGFTVTSGSAVISLPTAGFQPKSTYEFGPSFKIKNNSSLTRDITLSVTGLPTGVTVDFTDGGTNPFDGTNLAAGNELTVGLKFTLAGTGFTLPGDFKEHTATLKVTAN